MSDKSLIKIDQIDWESATSETNLNPLPITVLDSVSSQNGTSGISNVSAQAYEKWTVTGAGNISSYVTPFLYTTSNTLRGKFLQVFLNGQRLTEGVEYSENVSGSDPINTNIINFADPAYLENGDILVVQMPTITEFTSTTAQQTASYIFTQEASGNISFNIQTECNTDFQFITGADIAGKALSVYLNGTRLFHGIDYIETNYNNVSNINEDTITFTLDKIFEVDDHLFFQTVYAGLAESFTNPRTIYLSGDVSGSVSWDGTTDVVIPTAIANDIASSVPVGCISYFASSGAPTEEWLVCNGQSVNKSDYPLLWDAIGDTYAYTVNNTTGVVSYTQPSLTQFKVPDLRGLFVRGVDSGRGMDAVSHLANTYQHDATRSHTHTVTDNGHTHTYKDFQGTATSTSVDLTANASGNYTNTNTSSATTGITVNTTTASTPDENRPKNISLLPCIKAKGLSNGLKLNAGNPIGSIIGLPNSTIPYGYVACDGQSLNKYKYDKLFSLIGLTYGGSGNYFNVPTYSSTPIQYAIKALETEFEFKISSIDFDVLDYSGSNPQYTSTWVVPTGVNKIQIEAWGGGGGGCAGYDASTLIASSGGGGGGGGYIQAVLSVTPGEVISYTIGRAGEGVDNNLNSNGVSGKATLFGNYFTCNGGTGATATSTNLASKSGSGGTVSLGADSDKIISYMSMTGGNGQHGLFDNSTTYRSYNHGGIGGSSGNYSASPTGYTTPNPKPGVGGNGGDLFADATRGYAGSMGGHGKIIIKY